MWAKTALRLMALLLALTVLGVARPAGAQAVSRTALASPGELAITASSGAPGVRAFAPASLASLTATAASATSATNTPTHSPSASAAPSSEAKPPVGQRLAKLGRSGYELVRDLAFKEWPSPLFEANFWNTTLAGVRVVLPLGLVVFLLWGWIVRRGHGRPPDALVRHVTRAFCVLGFLTYYGAFNPNIRHAGFYAPSAYFNTYLGEKYRAELGDGALVECTLAAEKSLTKNQTHGQRYVYARPDAATQVLATTVAGSQDPAPCEARFTPERWQTFRNDVVWFASALTPEVWAQVQHSRVAPTSPVYRVLVSPLVGAPAGEAYFRVLALLEPASMALALWGVAVAFGPIAAAVVGVTWGSQPLLPFETGAGLLSNAWLVAWILGACAWRRDRGLLGGVLLGLGAGLQPLSALGLLPVVAAELGRRRQGRPSRPRRAALALVATLVLAGGVSAATSSYRDYASELVARTALPALSDVGLRPLLTNHGAARYRFQRAEGLPDPSGEWTRTRSQAMAQVAPIEWTALALTLAAFGWLAWQRRSLGFAAALGLCWSALYTQAMGSCSGLIALALVSSAQVELAVPLLTAVSGAALLNNQTVFADDRAAMSTALIWLTTWLLTGASWPRRSQVRSSPASSSDNLGVAGTPGERAVETPPG